MIYYDCSKYEIGNLYIFATEEKLINVSLMVKDKENIFRKIKKIYGEIRREKNQIIIEAFSQINEYMKKKRKSFNLPILLEGTDFQKKVWRELEKIPYGTTATYKDIAVRVGVPKGARAIGQAVNKNPIGIIIPCHRVIGSDNRLVGYAGGLEVKEYLLNLEEWGK